MNHPNASEASESAKNITESYMQCDLKEIDVFSQAQVKQAFADLIRVIRARRARSKSEKNLKKLLKRIGFSDSIADEPPFDLARCDLLQLEQRINKEPELLNAKATADGNTLLHSACRIGQVDKVKLLVENRAMIDSFNKTGLTPLDICLQEEQIDCMNYLLANGASAYRKDKSHIFSWCLETDKTKVLLELLNANRLSAQEVADIQKQVRQRVGQLNPARVMILGPPSSGKSTLVRLIEQQITDQKAHFPTQNLATDGIAVSSLGNFQFWDFGGQETLYATHQFFLSEEVLYMVVVNFQVLEDPNERAYYSRYIRFWLSLLRVHTLSYASAPVILVGSHCDKIDKRSIKPMCELLLSLAAEENVPSHPRVFRLSNSKKVFHQVNKIYSILREFAVQHILSQRGIGKGSMYDRLNLAHTVLRVLVEQERNRLISFIWWEEFVRMAALVGLRSADSIAEAARYLVNFGCILTYRQQSTGACPLVILDPGWLNRAFTSIVSIKFQSSRERRGFFTKDSLERNWRERSFDSDTWKQLERLLSMFQMLVRLPTGDYFVPAMVRSPKSIPPLDGRNRFMPSGEEFSIYQRVFQFSTLPFGLSDRLVVRLLHYPGMVVAEKYTTEDDFFFLSHEGAGHEYYIRMQTFVDQPIMSITLHSLTSATDKIEFSFFVRYVFESVRDLLSAYTILDAKILETQVFYNNEPHGTEQHHILQAIEGNFTLSHVAPDLYMVGVPMLANTHASVTQKIGVGSFGIAWLGQLDSDQAFIVFKQPKYSTADRLREFLREIIIMGALHDSRYIVKLFGVCTPSLSMQLSCEALNQKLESTLLMAMEHAPYGDLTTCRSAIASASFELKLKLVYDVARSLDQLHRCSGLTLIHRDVRSQNVFVFSLDEAIVDNYKTIHAKLGDMGAVVAASPDYGEQLSNWQYMAPEAFHGALRVPYSQKVDVYSFGIVAWEIFAGQAPFIDLLTSDDGDGPSKILAGVRPKMPDILVEKQGLWEIICQCWQSDPYKRPPFSTIVSKIQEMHHPWQTDTRYSEPVE